MSNATPSRLGQVNAAGDALALFLKVFAGEVLAAFAETNIMFDGNSGPIHLIRTISHGKTAQFPVEWKASAAYHTPGAEILGTNLIKANEKTIAIDSQLIADTFIANIDEAMNHYDVRSIYSFELGQALARTADKQLLQLCVLAARAAANISGGDGGSQLTAAGYDTTADTLVQGIYDAAQALDEKHVPEDGRVCVVRPKHYNLIVQSSKAINRDWNNPSGSNGTFANGKVLDIAGVKILKSNHLPNSVIGADSGANNTYSGTFTDTVAVVFHKSAVGTVKLLDLAMESEYDIRRQGTLMIAKYAMGHGILRPEASVELKKA
jgi:hypothetical protein